MLTAKMDLLLKRLDERVKFKEHMKNYAQVVDAPCACEVCENGGHSRNDWPKTRENVAFMNKATTGLVHKEAKGGTSHAHHIREVTTITAISIQTNPS
jgi:hypothetical protein